MLNIARAVEIAALLVGKDATAVNNLPAALAQAASDPLSAEVLKETAPGLDPATDADNVTAAVHFFGLPNALTVEQLRAAFGTVATLAKATA
jgi:hypothetical protein